MPEMKTWYNDATTNFYTFRDRDESEPTWDLDTGNDGCDENGLVGTYEQVLADVCHRHEIDDLPDGWQLIES